jgi:heat shock protein HslJ
MGLRDLWHLVALESSGDQADLGGEVTLALGESTATGSTPCSSYASIYIASPQGEWKLQGLGVGTDPCEPADQSWDQLYRDTLARVTNWSLESDHLVLVGSAVRLEFSRAAVHSHLDYGDNPPYEGGWRLVSMDIPGRPDLALTPDRPATAVIENSQVSGTGGCNSYVGSFDSHGGSRITVGRISMGSKACTGSGLVLDQESSFIGCLASVNTWSIDMRGRLVLEGPGGELVLESDPGAIASSVPLSSRGVT